MYIPLVAIAAALLMIHEYNKSLAIGDVRIAIVYMMFAVFAGIAGLILVFA